MGGASGGTGRDAVECDGAPLPRAPAWPRGGAGGGGDGVATDGPTAPASARQHAPPGAPAADADPAEAAPPTPADWAGGRAAGRPTAAAAAAAGGGGCEGGGGVSGEGAVTAMAGGRRQGGGNTAPPAATPSGATPRGGPPRRSASATGPIQTSRARGGWVGGRLHACLRACVPRRRLGRGGSYRGGRKGLGAVFGWRRGRRAGTGICLHGRLRHPHVIYFEWLNRLNEAGSPALGGRTTAAAEKGRGNESTSTYMTWAPRTNAYICKDRTRTSRMNL